jgi:hypothetical protein
MGDGVIEEKQLTSSYGEKRGRDSAYFRRGKWAYYWEKRGRAALGSHAEGLPEDATTRRWLTVEVEQHLDWPEMEDKQLGKLGQIAVWSDTIVEIKQIMEWAGKERFLDWKKIVKKNLSTTF